MAAVPVPLGRARGFTLIELMTVILVVAILAGLSAPMFTTFTRNQRIKAATSELTYTLTLARSEALKRNADVVVTPDVDGWEFGWTVTTAGVADPLLTYTAPAFTDSGGDLVSYLSISGPDDVTYNGAGRLVTALASPFELESADGPSAGAKTRCITVDLSGLPRSRISSTGECS